MAVRYFIGSRRTFLMQPGQHKRTSLFSTTTFFTLPASGASGAAISSSRITTQLVIGYNGICCAMIAASTASSIFARSFLKVSTQLGQQNRISRPLIVALSGSSITKLTLSLPSGFPDTGQVASGKGDPRTSAAGADPIAKQASAIRVRRMVEWRGLVGRRVGRIEFLEKGKSTNRPFVSPDPRHTLDSRRIRG